MLSPTMSVSELGFSFEPLQAVTMPVEAMQARRATGVFASGGEHGGVPLFRLPEIRAACSPLEQAPCHSRKSQKGLE